MHRASFFKIAYFLIGTFCAVTLCIIGIGGNAAKWFIRDDIKKYGELYDCCKIATFRIPLPVIEYPHAITDHPISESEIIFAGDSYFGKIYGKFFEKNTGVPVFNIWRKPGQSPVEALEELHYIPNGKQKYLVFETAERGIQHGLFKEKNPMTAWEQANQKLKNFTINAAKLEFFVSENQIMSKLIEVRNTFRFLVFKDISRLTPVYSIDPPMLHFHESVAGNRLIKTDADIEMIANKIECIAITLQQKYNLKMIFFPIPNKYSLYGYDYTKYKYNTHDESYDDFLPKLQKKLEEKSILSLDLYHEFLKSKEPVTEPTHDHWNARGMMLGLNKLIELYYAEERNHLSP